MRLGLIARMDNSGLGIQTKGFYDHLNPVKTMVIDISQLEPTPERRMKQYPERYQGDGVTFIYGIPTEGEIRAFLQDLDVVLLAESSYNMSFYQIARQMGVKTANQYNYEFFDWFGDSMWETPDMFIAPSTWHYDDVDAFCKERNLKHVYLHLPIDRSEIPRRHIDSARTFIHIAGRPAVHDRNGTYTFLNAIQLSEGALKGIVYTQNRELADDIKRDFPMVKVVVNLHNYAEMYKKGAVLVLPRKYGGNCLPLNEALAAGMPVIMSRLSPQTDFLPAQWLVAANKTDIDFVPRTKIDVYKVSPYELMIKMLWFKSLSNQDMKEQSNKADEIADTISWETMAPKYLEVLEALCHL